MISPKCWTLGAKFDGLSTPQKILSATAMAFSPEIRISAIAPSPVGVEMAAIVSEPVMSLCSNLPQQSMAHPQACPRIVSFYPQGSLVFISTSLELLRSGEHIPPESTVAIAGSAVIGAWFNARRTASLLETFHRRASPFTSSRVSASSRKVIFLMRCIR
jgi:hypothetical protein